MEFSSSENMVSDRKNNLYNFSSQSNGYFAENKTVIFYTFFYQLPLSRLHLFECPSFLNPILESPPLTTISPSPGKI